MISLENITKKYRKRLILDDITLDLPDTGLVLLIGKNGAGKTTLLNILAGKINYKGEVKTALKPTDIYYVYNLEPLYAFLTLKEKANIILGEDLTKLHEYLNKYNLTSLYNRKISTFSNGERQKVDLILAFIKKSKVTLLDEPLEYIDKDSKPQFIAEIKELSKSSLVIEAVHKREYEADIYLEIKDKKIEMTKGNNDLNKIGESYQVDSSIKILKSSFITMLKRPKINTAIFYVFASIMLFFVGLFSRFLVINELEVLNSVVKNTENNILYGTDLSYAKDNYTIDLAEDNALNISSEHKYSSVGSYKIVVSDTIRINGKTKTIADDEIYISDYLYNLYLSNNMSGDIIPKINEHDYKLLSDLHNSFLDNLGVSNKFMIYETNYRNYLPEFSEDSSSYQNEVRKFSERVDDYYQIAYMNERMAYYFTNTFLGRNEFTVGGNQIFPYEDYYIGISQFTLSNNLQLLDLEFWCNKKFAVKYLGDDNSSWDVNLKDNEYTFQIGDISLTLRPKYIPIGVGVPYDDIPILFLSYDMANNIYEHLGADKFSYYCDYLDTVKVIDDSKEISLDFLAYDFMAKDDYYIVINNNKTLKTTFIVSLSVCAALFVISILLYVILFLRKEISNNRILLNKGCQKKDYLVINYMYRVLGLILALAVIALLLIFLYEPIAGLFGVLY